MVKILTLPAGEVEFAYFEHQPDKQLIVRVAGRRDFKGMLQDAVSNYPQFGKGLKNIQKGLKILELVDAANGSLALEDDLYDCLKDAVTGFQWNTAFALAAEKKGFFTAVEKAEEVKKP